MLLDNVFNEIYMPDANTMMVNYENEWYKIEQVKADTLKQPEINEQINELNEKIDFTEQKGIK